VFIPTFGAADMSVRLDLLIHAERIGSAPSKEAPY
jgi:hypothetical protein